MRKGKTMAASRRGSIATVLRALVASAAFAAASTGSSVFADLTLNAYTQVNSSPNIPGSVTATIKDNGTDDVLITLTSNLTLTGSFAMDWGFNISDSKISYSNLSVSVN